MNIAVRKIVIYFSLLLFLDSPVFSNEQAISLVYSIRPLHENEKSILEVNLMFQGNESGTTEILLPSSWAGKDELYLEISELHCISSQTQMENTDRPDVKTIHHIPDELIQISYHVTSSKKQETEWYYRPLVKDTYFFFFGHCFFIIPNIDNEATAHISLEWKDFPSDWTLANSFGTQQKKQELAIPLATFQHAVYSGGDFQILQCGDSNAPIFVAIRGDWSFSNERLTTLVQTVIESHREFWNDFNFPYYLITVLPTGDDHYMGGTGLSNAFSIFIGDLSEEKDEDWKWLAWLLSHEHFHTWNGLKMMSSPPEGSMFWFTEGFTEYYAVKLNYRRKLIGFDDYIDHINSILYDYYVSPVHNAANKRIQQDFWNDWDVQRLPYVRGFLFALEWENKIKEASHGQYSLDDFMLALFHHTQKNQNSFSQSDIEQVAGIFLPLTAAQEDVQKYIVNGETIFPRENDFSETCSVKWMENLGFNVQQTQTKGAMEGIKQESKAFDAGLRNGQKFSSYQTTDQLVSVVVVDQDNNYKKITYPRDPSARLIPQYKPK